MSLKRSGAYRQAWLATLPALLFLVYEGAVAAHLIALGNWGGLLGPNAFLLAVGSIFGFLALLANIVALVMPFALFANARSLRNVRANVERAAPPATFQPDLSLALRDGETLTLTYRKTASGSAVRTAVTWIILLPLFALSGEALVVPLVPAALAYVQSLLSTITPLTVPNLSAWDWSAIAFPPIVTLALVPQLILTNRSARPSQIVADDRGITRHTSRRRSRFIPWSDIRVFLRGADSPIDSADGGYTLWGREHFLQFGVISLSSVRRSQEIASKNNRTPPEPPFTFDGGYEQYLANARRLLATIRARSGEPLRARAGATRWLNWGKRRFPTVAVELEDARAAPVANPPWQPTPEIVAAVPPKGSLAALVVLRPRLSAARMAVGALAWLFPSLLFVGACGGVFGAFLYFPLSTAPYLEDQSSQVIWLIIAGILVLTTAIASVALARAQQRRRLPVLVTDDLGITRAGSRETAKTLPWSGIRAWAVLPPRLGDPSGPTYFLFTDATSLTWREPDDAQLAGRGIQGDRQRAYREHAAELHALIAARTGLPLRELGLHKPHDMLTA
jgi:hypothetical protein